METINPDNKTIKLGTMNELSIKVIMLLLQKDRKNATEEITNYIKNNNYIKTLRNDDKAEIWIYRKGIYIPNGKSYIEEICREALREGYSTHIKNDVLNKIMADTFIEQENFFENQNKYINIIPVQNGLLNIETKELNPFSPNIFFFNKLPVSYTPGQDCPAIKKFFLEILDSPEDFLSMQELFGFSLLKEYRYEKSFMFLGDGRNGKSKAIDILKRFLGVENCANLNLKKIEKDSFSICELQNKLVNISGDIGKTALEDTGDFKALTGRDMIHASRKFKTMVKFENYAKMIFAANELPKTSDLTESFFQRWEILNFPYTFYNNIDYAVHQGEDGAKIRNPNIVQDILNQDELNGMLNWALEGLVRLQNQKVFTCTKTSEEIRNTWIRKSDSAASFVDEMINDDYDGFLSWAFIKMIYKNYCQTNKLKMLSDRDLRKTITDNTVANSSRQMNGSKQVRGYDGIRIKSTVEKQVGLK